ncbi:hypothetical protein [Kamptonema sp. UHCC 0994]|uniref:hypothetical protein n=1 Tax=Kamptonema sp. UHCC 0994 TaxID=3031329 RepID=UPI0023B9E30B|nr:hypothetical protein [Kamptonema sp. UHCC 0994]MDF0555469.1 hypothetical protein [Kamptonema sp. UHCC 0994]
MPSQISALPSLSSCLPPPKLPEKISKIDLTNQDNFESIVLTAVNAGVAQW